MLDLKEPGHPHGPFPRELVAGAKARAQEMGFSVAEFTVGEGDAALSWSRIDAILQARSTLGVIILPSWFEPDITALDWARYASIYTDYVTSGPALHSVCCEHYGSMLALLLELAQRGYRRPGLLLEQQRDERIGHRQSAAFRAFHHARGTAEFIPPLITREYPDFKTEFAPWFREHRPDVVLSHFVETRDWVRACAPAIPPGFVLLNILDRTYPCAALDLQPRILGARAAEMVVGQILRNEFGVPAWASRTTVQARFVEGPTIRAPAARRVAVIA
jgi:LacI family transcriptional regulator